MGGKPVSTLLDTDHYKCKKNINEKEKYTQSIKLPKEDFALALQAEGNKVICSVHLASTLALQSPI